MENFFGNFVVTEIGNMRISTIYGNNNCPSRLSLLHEHEDYELHIFTGGGGFVETDDDVYPFSHGTAILIPPNTVHWVNAENKSFTSDFTLMFSFEFAKGSDLNNNRELSALLSSVVKGGKIRSVSNNLYPTIVEEIKAVFGSTDAFAGAMLKNLFDRLYISLFKDLSNQQNSEDAVHSASNEKSKRAYYDLVMAKTIETYIGDNVAGANMNELAIYMNMSVRNAQRIVKRIYGKSFSDKLTEYRMIKAKSLILEGDMNLHSVSRAVGYSQYSGFHKAFTTAFGMTPSQYKHNKK